MARNAEIKANARELIKELTEDLSVINK